MSGNIIIIFTSNHDDHRARAERIDRRQEPVKPDRDPVYVPLVAQRFSCIVPDIGTTVCRLCAQSTQDPEEMGQASVIGLYNIALKKSELIGAERRGLFG